MEEISYIEIDHLNFNTGVSRVKWMSFEDFMKEYAEMDDQRGPGSQGDDDSPKFFKF